MAVQTKEKRHVRERQKRTCSYHRLDLSAEIKSPSTLVRFHQHTGQNIMCRIKSHLCCNRGVRCRCGLNTRSDFLPCITHSSAWEAERGKWKIEESRQSQCTDLRVYVLDSANYRQHKTIASSCQRHSSSVGSTHTVNIIAMTNRNSTGRGKG